jgi:NhaP-type Na+/H+ or K+/H+ antiporter
MVRQGLNVESGLNDGVCVPILVAAVAFAELEELPGFDGEVLVDLVKEISVAVVVGVIVAAAVASLVRSASAREWMGEGWARLVPLGTVLIAYPATVELHGSGFIAVFVAGLVYGRLLGAETSKTVSLDEELGQLLSAVTFLFFGAVMVGKAFGDLDVETVVYALLSLTFVRMSAVALSFLGSHATGRTVAFVGWFGPRGLATIVFTLTIVEESGLPGTERITNVATVTVALSVLLHGLTAPWLTDRYVRWLATHQDRLALRGEQPDLGATGAEA